MKFTQAIVFIVLLIFGSYVSAEPNSPSQPVGQVMFFTGKAYAQTTKNNKTELRNGSPVYIGQTLSTNSEGHLYLRMLDGAFLSLRPEAVVMIYQYTVDPVDPVNNQIRLDVQKGVVRSVTGKGGEANKAGFRLNTPVAAIGISGTDFTVYTSRLQSSVTIRQGGVVVSPFTDSCSRNSLGACDGGQAVKLLASNQQALAEVNAAHASLVNKANAKVIPDNIQPAHPEEDKSIKAVKETPVSQSQTTPATAETKVAEPAKESASTASASSTDTTSTTPKTSSTSNTTTVVNTSDKSGGAASNTGTTEAGNSNAMATNTNGTSSSTSTSSSSALVNSASGAANTSVATLNNASAGTESTAATPTTNAKVESTTTATPDVASLAPVTKEVGAKGSVTSELTGRVVTQTPSVVDLQPSTASPTPSTPTPATDSTPVVPDKTPIATKPQSFYWGRWTSYAETPEQNIRNDSTKSKQIFTANNVYLLASTEDRSTNTNLPKDRTIQFNLDKSEAVIKTGETLQKAEVVPGSASLSVDTGNNRFNTQLQVSSPTLTTGVANLYAQGSLAPDTGNLMSNLTQSNMGVRGSVNRDGTQAGYIFEQDSSGIEGATSWLAKP